MNDLTTHYIEMIMTLLKERLKGDVCCMRGIYDVVITISNNNFKFAIQVSYEKIHRLTTHINVDNIIDQYKNSILKEYFKYEK